MKNRYIDAIKEVTKPARDRIALAVGRVVLRLIDDTLPLQAIQIEALCGEVRDSVERLQNYGFTSVPLSGCRAVAVFPGGDRSSGIVVATDDIRYRKKGLRPGEVAVYNNEGDFILLKNGGGIEITTKHGVVVRSPLVTVPDGDVIASGISLKKHTHTGCQGGSTGLPN
ncbi:phage baseplate assembly protein V [Cloacibacillus evryensis]